jgi:hypothetical protein
MPEKRRFLDVWIVENNTVYREVPFMVVTDWIQQGRLLGDDRVRPSGTRDWYPIGESPTFAPYMPKVEEHRAEDRAEALEPVQIDFTWRRRPEDDDEDVDMIPLIDISLVLLIFFMMTASIGGLFQIDTPSARHKNVALSEQMKLWVGIDTKEHKGDRPDKNRPWYSLGLGNKVLVSPTRDRARFMKEIVGPIREELVKLADKAKKSEKVTLEVLVRLRADQSLPIEVIKDTTAQLKGLQAVLTGSMLGNVQLKVLGEVQELRAD